MNKLARRLAAVALGLVSGIVILLVLYLLFVHPELTHHLGTLAALAGATIGWVFVVSYSRRPWRQYEEGILIMRFTSGLSGILTYIAVANWLSPLVIREPSAEIIRLLIFGFVAGALADHYRLLRKAATARHGASPGSDPGSERNLARQGGPGA